MDVNLTETDLHSSIDDDPYHKNWTWLGPNNVDVSSQVSMGSNLATCGISITDEFCDDDVDGGNTEEDDN